MHPYTVEAEIEFFPSNVGGLRAAMTSPTPSRLAVFPSVDPEDPTEVQVGVMISVESGILPDSTVTAQLSFWADVASIHATPGSEFKLWYSGRTVGIGRVGHELTNF